MKDKVARQESSENRATISSTARLAESSKGLFAKLGLGRVIRSGVGTYDVLVDIPARGAVKCLCLPMHEGSPFGYVDTDLPIEGSNVIVALDADATGYGYVLGVSSAPALIDYSGSTEQKWPQPAVFSSGPNSYTERAYDEPRHASSDSRVAGLDVGRHRPCDVFPGEFVRINELGVGLDCDTLSARLRGGSASVGASFVDNTVEIVSKNFRHYTAYSSTNIVSSFGLITKETVSSPYLGERMGNLGEKEKRLQQDKDTPESDRKHPVSKPRMLTYDGYVGGIYSQFMARPKDCTEESDEIRTTDDTDLEDSGMLQFNVNENGRVMFRSVGGVSIERSDMIPVPVRVRPASDPESLQYLEPVHKDMLAFETPEDQDENRSPHYNILAISDRAAYEYKQSYERFLEFVADEKSKSESNFSIREEEDIDPPDDKAGTPDIKIEPDTLEKSAGRRSSILMPPDGSIILRDAWGSEVIFSGGNITFNTPGNVIVAPGKSCICLAGDDAVIKARNSIDIDAIRHDATVHGGGALKLIGGSDSSGRTGGVLIESFSNGTFVDTGADGEESMFTGITLKSTGSHVSILGKTGMIGALDELRIVTGNESDERTGRVSVATGQFGVAADDGITMSAAGGGVIASGGNVALAGKSVAVSASESSGVLFATPSQVGVPLWFDTTIDSASVYTNALDKYGKAETKDEKNSPYKMHLHMDETLFTYRTSEQCGTEKGLELTDPAEHFTLYQPFWAVMAKMKLGIMEDVKLTNWEDKTIDGTYPWPGKAAFEDGKYAALHDDTFVNLTTKTVEMRDKDGNKVKKKVLCSKKFDSIVGEKDSHDVKVDLRDLSSYLVRDVEAEAEAEES